MRPWLSFPALFAKAHPRLLHYDRSRRRLWIHGQRCHHGATGVLLCATGAAGLAAARLSAPTVAMLLSGSALMVHDWPDRGLWFKRGWQD